MTRNTKATIDLDAIASNYQLVSRLAPESNNIAVIKANAYGHGCIEVAKHIEKNVPAFAVAIFEEAVQLRDAGISKPILMLEGINNNTELEYASNHNIWAMVENELQAKLITGSQLKSRLNVWLKVDTGMHRLGLDEKQFPTVYSMLKVCPQVMDSIVICSQLACASDPDNNMTNEQMDQFTRITNNLSQPLSLANSAALTAFPETRLDWNRPGIILYGLSPFDKPHPLDTDLIPAMTFSSTVIGLREIQKGETVGYGGIWQATKPATIATVAAGYADGYPRHAASGTPVLVAGQVAKLAGRVSMDMLTVDVSDCQDIKLGDPVELWGKHINASEVAYAAQTITYDLLSGISSRVPRARAF